MKTVKLPRGTIFLSLTLLVLLVSCAAQHSNIGKTALRNQALSASTEYGREDVWQTQHLKIIYRVIESADTFTVSGTLHIKDVITYSFPTTEFLQLQINYLDKDNRVIDVHDITPNMGYKTSIPEELEISDVAKAPLQAIAFAFSYWGIFTGEGIKDVDTGDWEVYFDPFVNDENQGNPKRRGLFIEE